MTALHFLWNPSEGIEIGPINIRFYSMMFIIAFLLGWYIMKKIFQKEGYGEVELDKIFLYSFIAILVGARLGHVIFYQSELFREDPLSILLPIRTKPNFEFTGFSGLASHGAAIAMIIAMYIYSKKVLQKHVLWILDRVVLPVSLGGVFVRFGNFFNSEITGHKTSHPFGIKFLQEAIPPKQAIDLTGVSNYKEAYKTLETDPQFAYVINQIPAQHPTQLYEAFGYIIVFAILMFLYWKTSMAQKLGKIFGLYLILLWGIRFFVEFVKESQGGFEESWGLLSTGQWLSIPFILIGFYLLLFFKKTEPR